MRTPPTSVIIPSRLTRTQNDLERPAAWNAYPGCRMESARPQNPRNVLMIMKTMRPPMLNPFRYGTACNSTAPEVVPWYSCRESNSDAGFRKPR